MDILIKNGHVMDPAAGVNGIGDVAISGRTIAVNGGDSAEEVIDATGCYVFPGLIDMHTHVFYNGSEIGVPPDWLLASGVTSVIDAGSTGCATFEAFCRAVVQSSVIRVAAQLHLYPAGQPDFGIVEDLDPCFLRKEKIQELFLEYPDILVGLKLRMDKTVRNIEGSKPLEAAVSLGDELGQPVVVHASNPACPTAHIARLLRENDIFCHCFHGKRETIIGLDGKIMPEVLRARERGVLFDCSNGWTNYNHEIAKAALAQGFLPDIISTDITNTTFNLGAGFAKSLPFVMSKYLALGMDLYDIVRAVTATPAKHLGWEKDSGTLRKGARADVSVFKLTSGCPAVHSDNTGCKLQTDKMLIPQLTVARGKIAYRQINF